MIQKALLSNHLKYSQTAIVGAGDIVPIVEPDLDLVTVAASVLQDTGNCRCCNRQYQRSE